ncbi:hypothetical protein M419DRAFT_119058 [Trichoderma reesei RUT C-30]|uniref:Uncharacterized protein n=1 Tax=Hypocrea jecorina (strain ATCC 56765 / BCRC 32924 / NRRL 11460 / Rut C-30) TaxID=1344414 RepID=A0A024S8W1_HYPJR|nr:hypothetical protein M419DRAFT_119058 [Trichoderma reesei RUT C-30]
MTRGAGLKTTFESSSNGMSYECHACFTKARHASTSWVLTRRRTVGKASTTMQPMISAPTKLMDIGRHNNEGQAEYTH